MKAPISTTVFSIIAIFALMEGVSAEGAAPKQLFFEGDLVRGAQQGAPGPCLGVMRVDANHRQAKPLELGPFWGASRTLTG